MSELSPIQTVLIYGAGWSGRQIAAQFASHGVTTLLFDAQPGTAQDAADWAMSHIQQQVRQGLWSHELARGALERLTPVTSTTWPLQSIDLVLECVTEQASLKKRVLKEISESTPAETIVASNSSYFLPSLLSKYVVHPERFAHLHFHLPVWISTIVDVVSAPHTQAWVSNKLKHLCERVGQTPIIQTKENPGYIFNWLLQSLLQSSLQLVDRQIASVEDIDLAWRTITGMQVGPFGMMDQIGIDLIHQVLSNARWLGQSDEVEKLIQILQPKIDAGHLGVKSGVGFFRYDQPLEEQDAAN